MGEGSRALKTRADRWTKEEESLLVAMVRGGHAAPAIARALSRSRVGVERRRVALGLDGMAARRDREAADKRLYGRIKKTPSGCWEFTGRLTKKGYGRLHYNGKEYQAHRASYEIHRGPIPGGLCVCHHCDNRRCVNPEHLFLGTNADNTRDMMAKGRHRALTGDANPNRKIGRADVADIRRARTAGATLREISGRWGISVTQACRVISGESWGGASAPS